MASPTPTAGAKATGAKPPHRLLELSLLMLLALLWGSSYLFSKTALAEIPPVTLIALRVSIAAAFLVVVMVVQGERFPRDGRTWRLLAIQAVFNSIGGWTVLAWGQQYVDSGLASVLNSTSPLFVFFITLFVTRHEATGPLKLLGACLGIGGIVCIVGLEVLGDIGNGQSGLTLLAQMAVLLSALLYAGAAIFGKRFTHLSPTVTAAGTMLLASAVLIPASLILEQPWTLRPSAGSIASVLTLGTACTGVAFLVYFRLVRTLGSMGVASQSYLRAGVGVALGVVVLGETITPAIGLGVALALVGVALINLPSRKRSRDLAGV